MGLENATTIGELDPTNPKSTDLISEGDEHIKMIKQVLVDSFTDSVVIVQRKDDYIPETTHDQTSTGQQVFQTLEFTPLFEDSVLDIEYRCSASTHTSTTNGNELVLQLWDSTTVSVEGDGGTEGVAGVPITQPINVLGRPQGAQNTGGIRGTPTISTVYSHHAGVMITVELKANNSGSGSYGMNNRHLIITEYN
jgi:hypothetical protein